MIKFLKDMPSKHYEHNCGGELYVDACRFLEADEALHAGSFFGRVTMVPGSSVGYHEQKCNPDGDLEVYYIIEGKYLATLNGKEDILGPGDVMVCYNGDWNGLKNIGDTTGTVLAMIFCSPDRGKEGAVPAKTGGKVLVNSDRAPAAVGPFSHAIEANGMIYASGQLPIDFESGQVPEGLEAQTRASMKNLEEVLKAGGSSLNDVVKTTVYLSDIANFGAFNDIYKEYFAAPFPARSCYAVKDLPKGALVEIEAIAVKR